MKNLTLSKGIFAFLIFWSCITIAAEFDYSEFRTLNFDEMDEKVRALVTAAEEFGDEDLDNAQAKLKEALQLIFSRPDDDNLVTKLIPQVRTPLRNVEAYEKVIKQIANEALKTAKNKGASAKEMTTAFIVLGNIMAELKPEAKSNKEIQNMYKTVRDADIEVSDKVKKELRMRAMIKAPKSPSEVASAIIGKKK